MSDTRHNNPQEPRLRSASTQDEHALYVEYETTVRRVAGSRVNTSDANLDDACSFRLGVKQPRRDAIFAWLLTVATREA